MPSHALTVAALAVAIPACGDVAAQRNVSCGAQPVQVLPNGSFDAATPAWMQDPVTTALICGPPKITPVDGAQAEFYFDCGDTATRMPLIVTSIPLG